MPRSSRPSLRLSCAALAAGAGLVLTGCGDGGPAGTPSAARVPLARGARIVTSVRRCDAGRNAYCALQLVVTAPRYASSQALQDAQAARLHRAGWSQQSGDTDHQLGAESPGHRLRLTYAPGPSDLQSVDVGTIQRARPIQLSLSERMFARAPTLSMLLQTGS